MACKDAILTINTIQTENEVELANTQQSIIPDDRLYFGVDSETPTDTLLQQNLSQFEWATINKLYPNFWGRYIGGENALSKEEASFIRKAGCKIAPIFNGYDKANENTITAEQGAIAAKKAFIAASELGFRLGTIIFLEIDEKSNVASEYLQGFAESLLKDGYIPGFYANTDSKSSSFSHQFSRGHGNAPDVFNKCKVWATSPNLPEYFETVDTHTIHPDNWKPYCPSCITRDQIAIWQYGRKCHPVDDDLGNHTFFNVNLIKNTEILVEMLA